MTILGTARDIKNENKSRIYLKLKGKDISSAQMSCLFTNGCSLERLPNGERIEDIKSIAQYLEVNHER